MCAEGEEETECGRRMNGIYKGRGGKRVGENVKERERERSGF